MPKQTASGAFSDFFRISFGFLAFGFRVWRMCDFCNRLYMGGTKGRRPPGRLAGFAGYLSARWQKGETYGAKISLVQIFVNLEVNQ